jgi:hypothetical protein
MGRNYSSSDLKPPLSSCEISFINFIHLCYSHFKFKEFFFTIDNKSPINLRKNIKISELFIPFLYKNPIHLCEIRANFWKSQSQSYNLKSNCPQNSLHSDRPRWAETGSQELTNSNKVAKITYLRSNFHFDLISKKVTPKAQRKVIKSPNLHRTQQLIQKRKSQIGMRRVHCQSRLKKTLFLLKFLQPLQLQLAAEAVHRKQIVERKRQAVAQPKPTHNRRRTLERNRQEAPSRFKWTMASQAQPQMDVRVARVTTTACPTRFRLVERTLKRSTPPNPKQKAQVTRTAKRTVWTINTRRTRVVKSRIT